MLADDERVQKFGSGACDRDLLEEASFHCPHLWEADGAAGLVHARVPGCGTRE